MDMSSVVKRFLNYVRIDTQSVPNAGVIPSSEKQKNLAFLLADELKELGVGTVSVDESGTVYASIPASAGIENLPSIGFIAHMDTSPAVSGKDVRAHIVSNYDGGDIVLNEAQRIVLSPVDYPEMLQYKGQDLIVTDGTTLLGADDKAGIAEIMTMVETLMNRPEISHGEIKIAFTPDEEVGHGTDAFDVKRFGADFAYTVDGGQLGEIEYENFNAASVNLTISGKNIHPGYAKGKMKNALLMAMEFQQMLPVFDNPSFTEGYEGFFHLETLSGTVEQARAEYIIRDHDRNSFETRKECIRSICSYLNDKYGEGAFTAEIEDSYYNMKEKVAPYPFLMDHARQAMINLGVEPSIVPIRGGTDGARLSFMGLPCPNLCAGGHNFHGRFEYVPVQSLEKISDILVEIVRLFGTAGGV